MQKQPEAALDALDMAVSRDPTLYYAWMDKGTALLQLGRPADAVSAYDHALALRVDDLQAREALNQARSAQRRADWAERTSDLRVLRHVIATLFMG